MFESVLQAILEVVAPVFLVAAVGFVYARRRTLPIGGFTDLIIYLTGACLVFDKLSTADRFDLNAARAPMSAALLIAGGLVVGWSARRMLPPLARLGRGAVLLPSAFMNAGNLGLPLAALAYGDEGLSLAMLFFVTFSAMQYSVGIAIVKGRGGLREVTRLPLVYAAVLGVAFNQMGWTLPQTLSVPVHMLGETVIPLMLLSLGARLATLMGSADERPPLLPVLLLPALRMGGGFLIATLVNLLLGNEGTLARVTLVVGILPPAVMNFALVEKFGDDPAAPAIVSGAIAVGTVAAMIVLPVVLALL
ncbi:MAG: AEC family transporter [Deltaproteobacteria bacterium]|jgi:predicted permease